MSPLLDSPKKASIHAAFQSKFRKILSEKEQYTKPKSYKYSERKSSSSQSDQEMSSADGEIDLDEAN